METEKSKELCFMDGYSFLSNFYMSPIIYNSRLYPSAEHFFQAVKCAKKCDQEKIRNTECPRSAKIIGRFVETRVDWEKNKVKAMEKILRMKFRKQSKMRRLLRETGDVPLMYINYWHDTFWGCCTCTQHKRTGENMLGVLLMKIRGKDNFFHK